MQALSESEVNRMQLPDLRTALRARGLNPGGGKDQLRTRLLENLGAAVSAEAHAAAVAACAPARDGAPQPVPGVENAQNFTGSCTTSNNNYQRAGGQNVGNFLTDKPTSRVLAPPGGKSNTSYLFGGD